MLLPERSGPLQSHGPLERSPLLVKEESSGEKWPTEFCLLIRLTRNRKGSLTCHKSATRDPRLYFPSEGRHAEDFYDRKNLTASAGFEPVNSANH
jgi:hypothetical protein